MFDVLIKNAYIIDGTGKERKRCDLGIEGEFITAMGGLVDMPAKEIIDGEGFVLAPGFIDVHTHDDLEVVRNPDMMAKLSQGVTTVVVGNCGISASPYIHDKAPVDPINLLGTAEEFNFPQLADYVAYLKECPANVNVVALVGHTALRAQVMTDLSLPATVEQIEQMKAMLYTALQQGAKGLSTGLAYKNAKASPSEETEALAALLGEFDALYTTHLRTEFDGIIDALDEAFLLGQKVSTPVVISHLKCAGKQNWGRAEEVISHVQQASKSQQIACDCYPYHASSSTLDLNQVTDEFDIFITWSESEPHMAGQTLADIAHQWQVDLTQAAQRLMPAGAVYHGMNEEDVKKFIAFDQSMIGSDGLPCDPHPHPRLWGAFPRVLGRYAREQNLLSLEQAVHKMTGLSAKNFKLVNRGVIAPGYFADLVLFDANTIKDKASFTDPIQAAQGVKCVWVNGKKTYQDDTGLVINTEKRPGKFLSHCYVN